MWNGRKEEEKKWCFVEEAPSNLASGIHTDENVYEKHPIESAFTDNPKARTPSCRHAIYVPFGCRYLFAPRPREKKRQRCKSPASLTQTPRTLRAHA